MGHLQDITLRALAVLRAVDRIAAEDTRHTQGLLAAHGIRARLMAAHEHNEERAAAQIVALLDAGEQVAFVSDAGTPGISDPGARLVARVREAGHPVVPIPGASAVVAAMSVSGLLATGFRFVGFLPPKRGARRSHLAALRDEPEVLAFYEAPHRVRDSVGDMAEVLGARAAELGGEIGPKIMATLTPDLQETVATAIVTAIHPIFWIVAVMALIGLGFAQLLREVPLETRVGSKGE